MSCHYNVSGQNSATGKLCSFSHQFQEFVFAFLADHRGVTEIDDQLSSV